MFSKLVRAITLAARAGGADINTNYKLRVAVEAARSQNMPKETIERAVNKAESTEALEEITYEGFGPGGVGVLVHVATDNRNRTAQEIKNIFEHAGGSLGGPGAVSFNFEPKGYLLVEKTKDPANQMLSLIDLGVEELEEEESDIEVYVGAHELFEAKNKIENLGFKVLEAELVQKAKTWVVLGDAKKIEKLIELIDALESHDDVQRVFDNAKRA
jgi:YebC/PmpR family DNA-binding regulatory protein